MSLHTVYIGLGSNLDNPLSQVKSAIQELSNHNDISLFAVSRIYKSKPLAVPGKHTETIQPDYINAAVKINTSYTPQQLLTELQAIEKVHNRVKEYRWGPRSLDLDILLYDELVLETRDLTIPHIEMANRDFVLFPLNDINPKLDIPGHGKLDKILLSFSDKNLQLVE